MADSLLNKGVSHVLLRLRSLVFWRKINDARQAVLINMAFNIGLSGLFKFKKTISAIKGGFYEKAAKEMLDSKWANQVGNRATELSEQMRTGEWQ